MKLQVQTLPRQLLGSRRRWQSHLTLTQDVAGSIPASPVLLYRFNRVARLHSCSPIGRGDRFKNGMLWVQIPPGVTIAPVAQLERGADLKNQMILVQIQSGA